MKPVAKIDLRKFARYMDPGSQKVLKILHDHHVPTRIVGGAVRDALLNKTPRDIDFVVDAEPSEILFLFDMYDVPTDTSGISHGTIKAIFGWGKRENKIEITSLGYRIQLHNQKPMIMHLENWHQDSLMRDLSINSMSMDLFGNVWDYQNGLQDLHDQRIKLNAFSKRQVAKDPNLIMRYFKAMSAFAHPKLMKDDLEWIKANAHYLSHNPDDDRIMRNLLAVQKSPIANKVIDLMCKLGLKKYLPYLNC